MAGRPEQSAAAPSPFTPIADYAFLSDCHTERARRAGRLDRLAVRAALRRARACSARCSTAGPGTSASGRSGSPSPSERAYEPGTNVLVTTWNMPGGWVVVRDALTMGPRRGEDQVTPHTRPPTDEDADHVLVAHGRVHRGRGARSSSCASRCSTTAARRRSGRCDDDRHVADATGAGQTIRLRTDMALGIEGGAVRARHELRRGREAVLRPVVGRASSTRRPTARTRTSGSRPTVDVLARVAGRARRSPTTAFASAIERSALDHQGPDLHADRSDGRGRDDVTARDPGRRAQLGLPLHVDPRLDVHAAGAALPQPRLGGGRVHAVHRRPRDQRGRRAADHVRHRRAPRPDRVDARRPHRLRGRAARCGSATARSTSARTTSSAPRSTRSCSTRAAASGCRAGCGRSSRPRPTCATAVWQQPDQGIWEARGEPKHYVSSKLMCWVAIDRASKLAGIRGDAELEARSGRRPPRRSRPTSSSTASTSAAC